MKIYAIAINTFKEAIRDKIFYSLVFFAVTIIGASILLSTLTVGEASKIVADISLGGINFFGVMMSIFVGIGLVYKELERKTIYTIISKPIRRSDFLLGKYLGLALTLLVYVCVMSAIFLAVLYFDTGLVAYKLLLSVVLIYFELLIMTAAAILFSTFTTPALSATYTLAIYIIGHLTGDLKALAAKTNIATAKAILNTAYYILPNLENFNIKAQVVHNQPISGAYMFQVMVYGLLYVAGLIVIAVMIFQKKNFK